MDASSDENFFELHPDDNPIKWGSLVQSATIYPEHAEKALQLIESSMGHTPKQLIYKPHEPFIRAHIESYKLAKISGDEYFHLVTSHIRDIRNDFMRLEKKCREYNEKDFYSYQFRAEDSKQAARKRLCGFLGYEPDMNHCLEGEILIRRAMNCTLINELDNYCDIDFEAGAITNYRRIFFTEGKEAADRSELMGLKKDIKRHFLSV